MKKLSATVVKPFNKHNEGDTITLSAGIINHLEIDGYVSDVRFAGAANPLGVKVTEDVTQKTQRKRNAKPKTE
jgi:hypothetical protein